MSRLVIDAHVHPQHFTPGFLKKGERFTYDKLEDAIMSELSKGNSRALLADMDRLGIDKAYVLTAFAMRNEMIHEQMQRHPERFIGFCGFVYTARAEWASEAEFVLQKAAGKGTTIYASTPPLEPPTELPLHIDWNLRQVMGLEILEEDRAGILGLNMARLCKLDVAELQRQKEDRYGEQISWNKVSLKWSPEDQPAPAGMESEGGPDYG